MGFVPDPPPERHRRQSYVGLEIASDPVDRAGERDFVVGFGPSPRTLARLTIRRPVRSALDLGTGPGLHALLAARHAERVVAVDISPRALAFAAHNARLNGIENVEWRLGNWLEPVADERFDLIVANPPYVISPESGLTYRDSGEPKDALVRRLLANIPRHLNDGGYAQVLCDWVPRGGNWRAPLEEAIAGSGCDAVILMYNLGDPEEYARGWNHLLAARDHREFERAVERWLAYYREQQIESIAFGLIVMRRRTGVRNWVRAIRVPARPTDHAGEHVERLFSGWDWVRSGAHGSIRLVPGSRLVRRLSLDDGTERISFEVRPNVGFAVRVDEETADALANGSRLPPAELRRLAGLGMLLTLPENKRKIEVA